MTVPTERLLVVGLRCNNACVFCAQGALRQNSPSFPLDLESIQAGDAVAIVGGEPTLDSDLPGLLQRVLARSPRRVVLQTNGRRLAYLAYARSLADAAPELALEISLQGSTAPMHDYSTSVPGSFEQTVKGLANARAVGLPASVAVVVTRSNQRHLVDIARLAHALGARAVRFHPAEPLGRARSARDRVVPNLEIAAPFLDAAEREARGLGLEVGGDGFVGLGVVEEAPAEPRALRVALPIAGRPEPAHGELRGSPKKSGEALATIFPDLFKSPANKPKEEF